MGRVASMQSLLLAGYQTCEMVTHYKLYILLYISNLDRGGKGKIRTGGPLNESREEWEVCDILIMF